MKIEINKYYLIVPTAYMPRLKEGIYLITGVDLYRGAFYVDYKNEPCEIRLYEITQVNEEMMADALNEMEAYILELNRTNTELKEQIGQDKTSLKAAFNEIDRLREVVRDLINNDITHLVNRIEELNNKLGDANMKIDNLRHAFFLTSKFPPQYGDY